MPTETWGRPVSGPDRSRPGRGALGSAGCRGGRGLHTSKLWPCPWVLLTGRGRSSSHPAAAGDPTPVRARGVPDQPPPPLGRPAPPALLREPPAPAGSPRRSEPPARSGRSPAPSAPEPSAARVVRRLPQPPGRCERPTGPGSAASRPSPPLTASPRPCGRAGPPVSVAALTSTPLTLPPRCSLAPRHALRCARTGTGAWAPKADCDQP